jgi:hypothetical protein
MRLLGLTPPVARHGGNAARTPDPISNQQGTRQTEPTSVLILFGLLVSLHVGFGRTGGLDKNAELCKNTAGI